MADDGAVPAGTAPGGADRSGKYLTFSLAKEIYGIPIARTKEIIGMLPLVSIPNTAPQVKGVINLRGRVIPVIDLRLRLGLREAVPDERTCIVVVEVRADHGTRQMGLLVDSVTEVLTIKEPDIKDGPPLKSRPVPESLLGLARMEEGTIALLNIDRLLEGQSLTLG